jgi:hypothetical protein
LSGVELAPQADIREAAVKKIAAFLVLATIAALGVILWATRPSHYPLPEQPASPAGEPELRQVSVRHASRVEVNDGVLRCVAFSPDGTVVACGGDRLVHLFDAKTGERLKRLDGHTGAVNSVAFSPTDGALLASGSEDKTIRLWEVGSGKPGRVLEGHTDAVGCVAFLPDGKTLVSGGVSPSHLNDVRLWDVATGQWEHRHRTHHARGCFAVALSADGKWCVVAGGAGVFTLYEVNFGLREVFWRKHDDERVVTSAAFSPKGGAFLTSGGDNTIRVWDVATGQQRLKITGPKDSKSIPGALFSPDGALIISVTENEQIQLWNTENGELLGTARGTDGAARGLAISPDGRLLATCGKEGVVKLWALTR